MGLISEDKVERWILPHLSKGKRGFKTRVCLIKIVLLILKRMKTGCQWRELVVQEYFPCGEIQWQNVYYYFNKWSKDGSFKNAWIQMLSANKGYLDMSSVQLDGSHAIAKRGGEAVGYQGRKSAKTTNNLFLSDDTGQMLVVAEAQSGNHNDLYNLTKLFEEMISVLEAADIDCRGIFLNADSGFDSDEFKALCDQKDIQLNVKANKRSKKEQTTDYIYFDEELYQNR
ncbi:MAG: transposase, partial [Chitinophagaceae bacterium]|nr:transposase [Chitinophagaceae bacterium]